MAAGPVPSGLLSGSEGGGLALQPEIQANGPRVRAVTTPSPLSRAFGGGIPKRSAKIALVVGPILTLINQGDALWGGAGFSWTKAALTFIVPYVVATLGALGGKGGNPSECGRTGPGTPCQPAPPSLSFRPPTSSESGARPLQARVHVTLKKGVLDPQGKAIESALSSLGFAGVEQVRQGKFIEVSLAETDPEAARKSLEAMCEKLLANTVIEDYAIELDA